jgi:hypothetical protein
MDQRERRHATAALAHQLLQGWPRIYADDALTRGLVADLAWSV